MANRTNYPTCQSMEKLDRVAHYKHASPLGASSLFWWEEHGLNSMSVQFMEFQCVKPVAVVDSKALLAGTLSDEVLN